MAQTPLTPPNTAAHEFYASCPEGFEAALADELRSFGLRQVRRLKGRVTFAGAPLDAYRACLWSRLASRVFVTLARFDCVTADDLYEGSRAMLGRTSSRLAQPSPSRRAARAMSCATPIIPPCA